MSCFYISCGFFSVITSNNNSKPVDLGSSEVACLPSPESRKTGSILKWKTNSSFLFFFWSHWKRRTHRCSTTSCRWWRSSLRPRRKCTPCSLRHWRPHLVLGKGNPEEPQVTWRRRNNKLRRMVSLQRGKLGCPCELQRPAGAFWLCFSAWTSI